MGPDVHSFASLEPIADGFHNYWIGVCRNRQSCNQPARVRGNPIPSRIDRQGI